MTLRQTRPHSLTFENTFDKSIATPKNIIEYYKMGYTLEILDYDGYNITKEFLVSRAFNLSNKEEILDFITEKITDEELESIIFAGGYESFRIRKLRLSCSN